MLQVKNVSKTYENGRKALYDISFDVSPGEFVSIIGPSGAGKSTIMRGINQLIPITSGEIVFDGQNVALASKAELRRIRRRIGMIFQHYNLVYRLTAVENVLHGRLGYKSTLSGVLGRYTEQEKEEAFLLLQKVGLEDFAYARCDQLSGGQKQRVGIARALMQHPSLILCDEPIASLDPQSSETVMTYLRDVTKQIGITCLVNLHQVEIAIAYSDRIIGVKEGRVVFDGAPGELTGERIAEIYHANPQAVGEETA